MTTLLEEKNWQKIEELSREDPMIRHAVYCVYEGIQTKNEVLGCVVLALQAQNNELRKRLLDELMLRPAIYVDISQKRSASEEGSQ